MTDLAATLSLEVLATLGNCRLGVTDTFVRCVPVRADGSRYTDASERKRAAQRIAAELGEAGIFWASSAAVGGDYVRVNEGTAAFSLVCQMKS